MTEAETPALAARVANFRALCRVLERQGLRDPHRLAAAFGPSMRPERLGLILSGGVMPDYLARSLEHVMCVPWHWLDERQAEVREAARHLLVEKALRTEIPRHAAEAAEVLVEVPLLPEL